MIEQAPFLLLAGGDKRKQGAHIKRAIGYFQDFERRLAAAVPHHDRVIEELRADREYAREYLRAAMEEGPGTKKHRRCAA